MIENAPPEYAQGDPNKNSFAILVEPFPTQGVYCALGIL